MLCMAQEPQPHEIESIKRAAVLVVAALTYPRLIADSATDDGTTLCVDNRQAALAFDAAEVFVAEAGRRGYDPAAIMQLTSGVAEL